jgi:hypothetical protein
LIRLLFENNEKIIELVIDNIQAEDILLDIHKKIFEIVYFEFENRGSLNSADLMNLFDDETQIYLRELTIEKYSLSDNWEDFYLSESKEIIDKKYAADIIIKYKQSHFDMLIAANVKAQENAEAEERLIELMKEKQELEKRKKAVRKEFEKD